MVARLLKMAGLNWAVPELPLSMARDADGPLNPLLDSTGIKFLGE